MTALYVSTPICNDAAIKIQKAITSSSTITVTGRNGTPVHATAVVQDGEYIASDEWEVYLKHAADDAQQSLSLAAFQGDLEVRIGGILLASFNDDDSQLSLGGGSSTCSSSFTTSEVGISFSESGMILRIVGEDGPSKFLTTTPKKNTKASSILSPDNGPKKQQHVKFKPADLEEKKEGN
jgi:hypothetical protein